MVLISGGPAATPPPCRLCFSVGTGSNAPEPLAKTQTTDFRPVNHQLIDETVDYLSWLTSCSYTSSLITYITGISGTSSASLCLILAAWAMNVRRRPGHVMSMRQPEHRQKRSLTTRMALSDSVPSVTRRRPQTGAASPSDRSGCKWWTTEILVLNFCYCDAPQDSPATLALWLLSRLMDQAGSSIYRCRIIPRADHDLWPEHGFKALVEPDSKTLPSHWRSGASLKHGGLCAAIKEPVELFKIMLGHE